MNFLDRLLGRGTKAAPARSAPTGSVTFLSAADQGSSKRMTNYRQYLGALSVPNVAKCASVVSANAASTPLLWRDPDANEVDLKNYLPDLYRLLRRPNLETRSLAFTQSIVLDVLLTGNFFCLLDEHDGLGRPHALYRLAPDRVRIIRSDVGNLAFGFDSIQNGVTRTEWYDQNSILHIKTFFNPTNPLFGLGIVEMSELSISRDRLIGEYSLNFFQKGATVDSILVSPNEIPEEDRRALVADWNAFRSGNRNRFKTAVLSSGIQFQKIQESVADVQLPQLANMALEDVCQCFGTPKQMLGDFRESNYRNSQEANSFFITETLTPLLRQITEDFWQPLGEYFDPDLEATYDIKEVNDFQLRCDSAHKLSQTGAATVNDVLVMAGLDPRDDAIGERLVQPQGVTLLEPEQAGTESQPPALPAPPTVTEVAPGNAATAAPAASGAKPGVKSFPAELLSRKKREEQRKRGIKKREPASPEAAFLRLLQAPQSAQDAPGVEIGAKAHDAPAAAPTPSEQRSGRVVVSARPTDADVARVAQAYSAWADEQDDAGLWKVAQALVDDGRTESA